MLAKFPDAVVEEWAPVLFLPLVTRLVNDPVAGVRAAVGQTLRALLQARLPVANPTRVLLVRHGTGRPWCQHG